jgi:DNA-binding GntR family transcriptional regulator
MPKPDNPIQRVPDLRKQVYDGLRESIKSGQFPLDVKIGEQAIADEFGVSRTPVREALSCLVRDGLLVQAGRGFRIPQYSGDDIADVFEVRLCLEPQAMRHLAEHMTLDQSTEVNNLLEEHFSGPFNPETYAKTHRLVRRTLFGMLDNARLRGAIEHHEDHVHFVRLRTLIQGTWQETSRDCTRKVLVALSARDAEAAAAAMYSALQMACDAALKTLDENDVG